MDDLRLAGADLGLDIREGMGRFDLDEMRRAFRRDKLIPRSLASEMNKMAPENSEPETFFSLLWSNISGFFKSNENQFSSK